MSFLEHNIDIPAYSRVTLAAVAVGVAVVVFIGHLLYNIFLHPLRRFPGPLLCRATKLRYIYGAIKGQLPFEVKKWHEQYGRIVRIAPNQLAFADPEAWKDIYGHRNVEKDGFEQMDRPAYFYTLQGFPPSLLIENNVDHRELRKRMAAGFSEKAMREQEPLMKKYITLLVRRLRERSVVKETSTDGSGKTGSKVTYKQQALDMNIWYNWLTFDMIGDLAFGEPFDCLEKEEYHPWVHLNAHMVSTSGIYLAACMLHLGRVIGMLASILEPYIYDSFQLSREKVLRRMALTTERPDFLENILKKRKESDKELDIGRLTSNAHLFTLAGSETLATLLCGVTFLLLKNPSALEKVKAEVRSSFSSQDEITLLSVSNLTYMLACLNEALRFYPPSPFGLPRSVPKGGGDILGEFIPEGTIVAIWHYAVSHLAKNWKDPESYIPERFLDEGKNGYDCVESIQPFLVGPRSCLGRNLAYAEMRLVLAHILFNFDIELADPNLDWMDQKVYVLWEKPSLPIYLKPAVRE